MFSLLALICALSLVNAATDDQIRDALGEKIAECGPNGYRFYASQGHDVPSQEDDVTFDRFKATYNNVITHNTAYEQGESCVLSTSSSKIHRITIFGQKRQFYAQVWQFLTLSQCFR